MSQNAAVFVHEGGLVVLEHEEHARLELLGGDVEGDDDLVHFVEHVSGAAGGEDHGGEAVVVDARRRRRRGVGVVLDHADG